MGETFHQKKSLNNSEEFILEVKNLKKSYGKNQIFNGISFKIKKGEIFSIFGPSGVGKSTLAKIIAGLEPFDSGKVLFKGIDISIHVKKNKKNFRRSLQIIFQDSTSVFNPRMSIKDVLFEPLKIHKIKNKRLVYQLLNKYGLSDSILNLSPYTLSGGQRQRIALIRSLVLEPEFIILDEVFRGLDDQVKAQLINFLIKLKNESNITILLISHEKKIVEYLADTVYYLN